MFDVSSEVSAYDPVTGIVYGMCDVSSEVSAYDSVIGISYGMSVFEVKSLHMTQ